LWGTARGGFDRPGEVQKGEVTTKKEERILSAAWGEDKQKLDEPLVNPKGRFQGTQNVEVFVS